MFKLISSTKSCIPCRQKCMDTNKTRQDIGLEVFSSRQQNISMAVMKIPIIKKYIKPACQVMYTCCNHCQLKLQWHIDLKRIPPPAHTMKHKCKDKILYLTSFSVSHFFVIGHTNPSFNFNFGKDCCAQSHESEKLRRNLDTVFCPYTCVISHRSERRIGVHQSWSCKKGWCGHFHVTGHINPSFSSVRNNSGMSCTGLRFTP